MMKLKHPRRWAYACGIVGALNLAIAFTTGDVVSFFLGGLNLLIAIWLV